MDKIFSETLELQRRIRKLEGLPTMPTVLQQIWDALRDPDCSARRLATAIATDPGLTARILRMSNSAYYGLSRQVSDVTEATVVLGVEVVKSLAIGSSVVEGFRQSVPGFDMQRFWQHSVHCAVAAEAVARTTGGLRPEVAFCSGILHDVGKLVLAAVLREDYAQAAASFDAGRDPDWVRWEKETLGADHQTVGLWVAERWKFSHELVEVIAFHHRPDRALSHSRLVTAVCLAESMLDPGHPPILEVDTTTWDPRWAELLGADEAVLGILRDQLPARLRAAGSMAGF
ncbi:MAG TPA: HDOD domain-containing protein [Candidatus Saccharimonadales bacterium]|nr:HDOD domain-containing protein [Candidatus Saccharimonadales bacterium]